MKLIDKDALVAEIERRIKEREEEEKKGWAYSRVKIVECEHILSFLDTLEMKEVNLKKELDEWVKYGPHTSYPWCTIPDAIKITAKHFFELGLKAPKVMYNVKTNNYGKNNN